MYDSPSFINSIHCGHTGISDFRSCADPADRGDKYVQATPVADARNAVTTAAAFKSTRLRLHLDTDSGGHGFLLTHSLSTHSRCCKTL